jgi:glycosyltransferase involved in cell wall biosynthesis
MLITVFTPTYNRGEYLPVLYQSLLTQNFKDFEWVIVDDGSTDNTADLVQSWKTENKIDINFITQSNSGKHIAINKGAAAARGALFFTVDSDDYLTDNALERIAFHWSNVQQLPEEEGKNIIGLGANRIYQDGSVIGGNVNYDILDTDLLDLRFVRNIKGDKAEIYKTKVVQDNPFPLIEGERFCPESLIFYRLANQEYKLRFFNEDIYVCEYLEGGLTRSSFGTIKNGPIGALQGYADMTGFSKVPFMTRMKYAILFWRFSFYDTRQSLGRKAKMLSGVFYTAFYPLGLLLYLKDRLNDKR